MANKKKILEKNKKTCNQLIKSQLLTQRTQSSKPSGRVQSAGDTAISEAQKQGILRSMKPQTRTANRINNYIYICYKYYLYIIYAHYMLNILITINILNNCIYIVYYIYILYIYYIYTLYIYTIYILYICILYVLYTKYNA